MTLRRFVLFALLLTSQINNHQSTIINRSLRLAGKAFARRGGFATSLLLLLPQIS
jgi:hypothetical protein